MTRIVTSESMRRNSEFFQLIVDKIASRMEKTNACKHLSSSNAVKEVKSCSINQNCLVQSNSCQGLLDRQTTSYYHTPQSIATTTTTTTKHHEY